MHVVFLMIFISGFAVNVLSSMRSNLLVLLGEKGT